MPKYEISPCPVCGCTTHRVLADRETIARELEALWQFHLRRMPPGVPLEQFFDRAIFSQEPPLQVVECTECGLVYRNPREREEELLETYTEEEPDDDAFASLFQEQLAFFRPRAAQLARLAGRTGSVLEVGSYVGGFLRAAQDAGWRARGIDVNEHAIAFARTHGGDVTNAALHDFQPNETFDAVALWNCFDQLPDPQAALAHVRTLLAPHGLLALRVPNGAFYAHVRRPAVVARAPLAWNNLASFPYRHGFTARSLGALLGRHGFEVVSRKADTLVAIANSYTRSWARLEERLWKAMLRRLPFRLAPWLEIYARKTGGSE